MPLCRSMLDPSAQLTGFSQISASRSPLLRVSTRPPFSPLIFLTMKRLNSDQGPPPLSEQALPPFPPLAPDSIPVCLSFRVPPIVDLVEMRGEGTPLFALSALEWR